MNKLFNKALMVILAAIIILSSAPISSIAKTVSDSPIAIVAEAASKKTHLNTTKKSIYIGKKYTLKLIDKKGKTIPSSKIKWSRSNKSVASVSQKGVVTGKKAGKIKITATYQGKKYTAVITVKSSVSVSKSKVTFKAGETSKQTIKVTCKDNKGIKWKTVEGSGIVKLSQAKKWKNDTKSLYITPTGKKFGTAKIKIYSVANSKSYTYLTIEVKKPYTLKIKNSIPCIISNYKSEEDAANSIVGETALIIRKATYKTPNTKTLVVTVDFEAGRSDKTESYYFLKYRILDKNGYLVESDAFKSKLMMVGDKAKAEITLKNLKNGSYTIEFTDYIADSSGSTSTTPDNNTPSPPSSNTPATPGDSGVTNNRLSDKEVVDLYKNAMNAARTEAQSVIRVKDGVINYKGIIEAGSLSNVASSLMGSFMSPDEESIEVTNEPWEKELLPDATNLTVNGLQKISYEEKDGKYIVTLVAKNASNPKAGDDGVGSISNVIEEDDLTSAMGSVPALQISNINMDYEDVTTVATIDKASGKLVELKLTTPTILSLDAKLAVMSVQNAKIGIQVISEYKINYTEQPGNTDTPEDNPTDTPAGNAPLTADAALAMYQKAAKEINTKGVAGYSKKSWQTVENFNVSGNASLQSTLASLIEGFLTTEEDAEVKVNAKGSEDAMRRMPISDCSEEYIKSVTTELEGENYIITIVMNDCVNPSYDDNDGLARMSNDFLDIKDVENTVKNDATVSKVIKSLDNAQITYKSYTITATMTKDGKFVSIEHFGPADISADMQMIIGNMNTYGTINFNAKYYDFKY